MYDKKKADGYEVLEIPKGTWIEAIFAKEKPDVEENRLCASESDNDGYDDNDDDNDDEDMERGLSQREDDSDDDDDAFDDDKLTEESYRTTYETSPDELNYEAEEISEDEGDY